MPERDGFSLRSDGALLATDRGKRSRIRARRPLWPGSRVIRLTDADVAFRDILFPAVDTRGKVVRDLQLVFQEIFNPFPESFDLEARQRLYRPFNLLEATHQA